MTSQLVILRASFFCPPDPKSEKKNSRKSTYKKSGLVKRSCSVVHEKYINAL